MWNPLRNLFSPRPVSDATIQQAARDLAQKTPVPLIWLFGKTGSGKSSIIRYLTGETEIAIGTGYRPQTRFSTRYDFPNENEPILSFLDTKGLGEVNYDPKEEIEKFGAETQLVLVVVRVMDHALDEIVTSLRAIRKSAPHRPVLLALTCLHDAYPGEQHPEIDPFDESADESAFPLPDSLNPNLRRSLEKQYERFSGLVDVAVPIDLTPAEEGYDEPEFGGKRLKSAIINQLPAVYRQTMLQFEELSSQFKDVNRKQVMPVILGTSTLAATAAAIPVPWVDIPLVMGIQTHLAYKIARIHRQKIDAQVIAQVTGALGGRVAIQFAIRETLKFIPWVGIAANATAAFAYTFAGGMMWNWYFTAIKAGHVPSNSELREVFKEQLTKASELWKRTQGDSSSSS